MFGDKVFIEEHLIPYKMYIPQLLVEEYCFKLLSVCGNGRNLAHGKRFLHITPLYRKTIKHNCRLIIPKQFQTVQILIA